MRIDGPISFDDEKSSLIIAYAGDNVSRRMSSG
jgi:hypothetical protein